MMPLRDHFHASFGGTSKWSSVHAMWAAEITGRLNSHWLGPRYAAGPRTTVAGHSEIDIATYEDPPPSAAAVDLGGNGVASAALSPWSAPAPDMSFPADIPTLGEVQVLKTDEGTLVAAIEIVSPRNKDRPAAREGFVGKCLDYLGQGVCVVVIDVVTTLRANLHSEIARMLGAKIDAPSTNDGLLYAVTYRPTTRDDQPQIDVWTAQCEVGKALPTMPMRLTGDTFVPVEFELTYNEACRRLKVTH
jgi:Protein of unknown function (DUF4058)